MVNIEPEDNGDEERAWEDEVEVDDEETAGNDEKNEGDSKDEDGDDEDDDEAEAEDGMESRLILVLDRLPPRMEGLWAILVPGIVSLMEGFQAASRITEVDEDRMR